MTPVLAGVLGIIVFVIFLCLRMPIGIAMALTGVVGFSYLVTPDAAFRMMSSEFYMNFANYSFSVIPMFVFMGYLAYHSGVGAKLFKFAHTLIGHLSGGIAMASEVACAIFGAVCGSATATTATIGSIALPEMKKYHYDDGLACAAVSAGGAIGVLIPPSAIFVLYGVATEQSITKLFISGIIPGIILTAAYCLAIYVIIKRNPAKCPASGEPRATSREIWAAAKDGVLEMLAVFVVSIGGLFVGLFTPTEAGAVGAAGVIVATAISRKLNWKNFFLSLKDTTNTTAMIMFMVAGAVVFTRFLGISRLPAAMADWVAELTLAPIYVMLIILLIYIILGALIEMIPLILLTVPIFYPIVVDTLHYDPIWFGVIICMTLAMGTITPPVGICAYVCRGIAKDVPLATIFSGVWPFLITAILVSVLLIVFPGIVTWLPNLVSQ